MRARGQRDKISARLFDYSGCDGEWAGKRCRRY
jgi:hypothetical protein